MAGFFLIPLLFIGAIFVLILLGALFGEKGPPREEVLGALAGRLGWSLDVERDRDFDQRFPQFSQFNSGNDRYAYNRMAGATPFAPADGGEATLECLAGDYHYQTTETRTRTVNGKTETYTETVDHHLSYLLVRPPFAIGPDLSVRPENFFDRIGAFFGFDDIDFESAEFSKAFAVNSDDKRFAYDVMHPRMMEFMLTTRPDGFRVSGGWLLISGGRWAPEAYEKHLQWTAEFFALWPRHLKVEGPTAKG